MDDLSIEDVAMDLQQRQLLHGLRPDLGVIAREVPPGARVLDVGCGDGALMAALRDSKGVDARGLELDAVQVERCVARGLSVVQGDANCDLADYPDKAFDYAVLSQTLQTSARPDQMPETAAARRQQGFCQLPNFAHWRTRAALMLGGKMPVTRALPVSWYETPNIHHVTIVDFRELVSEQGAEIERSWFFADDKEIGASGANWRAEIAYLN